MFEQSTHPQIIDVSVEQEKFRGAIFFCLAYGLNFKMSYTHRHRFTQRW